MTLQRWKLQSRKLQCLCVIENGVCVVEALHDVIGPGECRRCRESLELGQGKGGNVGMSHRENPARRNTWTEFRKTVRLWPEATSPKAERSLPPRLVGFCSAVSVGTCGYCSLCCQAHPAEPLARLPGSTALNAPGTQ